MKFWVRFSKSIFKLAAESKLRKLRPKLIESVLSKSAVMLDPEMLTEIRTFILSRQTRDGGFSDRGGKCDLYYSLFGFFIAEAFEVDAVNEPLKKYVAKTVLADDLSGVYRYCGAILYSKLIGIDSNTEKLRTLIVADLIKGDSKQAEYSSFLGMLALYYLGDFRNMWRIVNQYKKVGSLKGYPCPVVAATLVILQVAGRQLPDAAQTLLSFYRGNGGFAALHRAPAEDLLSTAVALFALHFLEADLRFIKPDCLTFVDDLYDNGGFCATSFDSEPDVEYTFYGLLALGSMS